MSEVELSAGTIEYNDSGGDGPVLVFLHGVAMDGSVWAPVIADLRRDHRCVVPTLPLGAHRRPMRRVITASPPAVAAARHHASPPAGDHVTNHQDDRASQSSFPGRCAATQVRTHSNE